jgi:N6-L-threonylcarbamoyladenine synthase
MVGMMTAKAIAAATRKPFLSVNHLAAHVLTPRLTDDVPFPYLTLLVSGGHTQILLVRDVGNYTLLGQSIDDAAGEAFDKSAKMMGLPYPGGPMIEKLASACPDADAASVTYPLPRPLLGRDGCDFSFAGLKTAMRQTIDSLPAGPIDTPTLQQLCASLQTAIGDILCDRVKNALDAAYTANARHFVVAGGVAANLYLRTRLEKTVALHGMELVAPPVKLCTDNGVMIAWAGLEQLRRGDISALDTPARPRWPLGEQTGQAA